MAPQEHSATIGEFVKLTNSPMTLALEKIAARKILGVGMQSQQIKAGWIFAALAGAKQHGLDYFAEVAAKMPLAILVDEDDAKARQIIGGEASYKRTPVIRVKGLVDKLPDIGKIIYNADELQWLGITGTNGKSSTAHALGASMSALGSSTAVIGSVYNGFAAAPQPSMGLTTPDILSLRRYGCEYKSQGARYIALECSSHGLEQGRTKGLNISCGVFTNLGKDHLDYHKTQEHYELSKYRLFQYPSLKYAVINCEDPVGARWHGQLKDRVQTISFGTKDSDIYAESVKLNKDNAAALVHTPMGAGELRVNTSSYWSISNSMAALGVMLHFKFDLSESLAALSQVAPLAGRMQRLSSENFADFVVDFAHSPDALRQTLISAKEHLSAAGKLWVIFGCGGERDKAKRALMGEAAARYADKIIVTNDNPRGEEPAAIIEDIMAGIKNNEALSIQDRSDAITFALARAAKEDLVVVAGKGHESYQEIMGAKHYFNDYEFISKKLQQEADKI